MIHINLNAILYTHIEHSPTKTVYTKYYMETHTHTHQNEFRHVQCCWFAHCLLLVVCVLSTHSSQSNWSWKQSSKWTLFIPVFFLLSVSLSLDFYTHTPIVVYICFIATEKVQFSTCVATQSHSFHPLTIHSSIRLQTHSHLTNHSLKPQALAIIPLHMYDTDTCTHTLTCTHIHTHTHMHTYTLTEAETGYWY